MKKTNIVTRALAKRTKDRRLKAWIAHWDALEALVIRVYKAKGATPQDEAEYRRLRTWLSKQTPAWAEKLRPYWRQATLAGAPAQEDPFARLLSPAQAAEFAGDWRFMQTLPAAREAINQYLLDLQEGKSP